MSTASAGPSAPQFIVVPRTGIQLCRRVPLLHLDRMPDNIRQAIWTAAEQLGYKPGVAPKQSKLPSLIRRGGRSGVNNPLLSLVAKYITCDPNLEESGWLACDESNAAFYRLVRIGSETCVDLVIDTQSGGGSMVSNRIPCIVSYGTAMLKREQEVCNFYVERYTEPKSVVGTLVIDYGNTGCAAIFSPDDSAPSAARAMSIQTPFDSPDVKDPANAKGAKSILKSTIFVLWAPESELTPPWIVQGNRAEQLIGQEDPLITSLYAPKKYVRDWPEHLASHMPTTAFRGVLGQRDGLLPKRKFVQHGIDQLLELVLASITNPNSSSVSPDSYPQIRTLLLTYPLTWREAEKTLFRQMFRDACERALQHDDQIRSQFTVELVCSEPVAVGAYALWEHLYYYYSYGNSGKNLQAPSLASSSLGNLTGEPHLRILVVDIGGGSTDIALLKAHWQVVAEQDDLDHVDVSFQQTEWMRFNRAGDRISHIMATALFEYMRLKYGISESLDFETPAANPGFLRSYKRQAVSQIMRLVEQAKASMVRSGEPWKLSDEDEGVLKDYFSPAIEASEADATKENLRMEFSLPVIKKWVELDRRSAATAGEPGFMDIFVYLSELAAQCRKSQEEINLVILSGRTTRLPFIREFTADALNVPWHRIRTLGDLLPDGLKTPDHADMDKLAVVYGAHRFRNGGPIRFHFSDPTETEIFHRVIGIVSDTPRGMKISKVLVSPGDSAPRTIKIKVPANGRIRLGQSFRADAEIDLLGIIQNSTNQEREIDIDLLKDFHVEMKRGKNAEGVIYTEWVSGGAGDIRDNFNDTGRIDCEPNGFIKQIVMSNQEDWIIG